MNTDLLGRRVAAIVLLLPSLVAFSRSFYGYCWDGRWHGREFETYLLPLRLRLGMAWTIWRVRYWDETGPEFYGVKP